MTLNLFLHMPERRHQNLSPREGMRNYRDTRIYQHMLRRCTASGSISDVAGHSHREFFGIAKGQFNRRPTFQEPVMAEHGEVAYGLVPISSLLVSEGPVGHLTLPHDVRDVQLALQVLGLPMELVLHVMRLADYYPQRKLNVPHDPLHPGNREELEEHLDYCWDLLVHCDMVRMAACMRGVLKPLAVECITALVNIEADERIEQEDVDLMAAMAFGSTQPWTMREFSRASG